MISRIVCVALCLSVINAAAVSLNRQSHQSHRPYTKNGNNHMRPKIRTTSFSNATTDLTFDLLKELSKTPGNVVFSPTSIGVLLSMLQQGASGKTREELTGVLHATPHETEQGYRSLMQPGTQEASEDVGVVHQVASKMFLHPSFAVNAKFQEKMQTSYRTDIGWLQSDPALSAVDINQWVENATHGHITDIMNPESLGANTALVLASALFFNGKWQKKFAEIRREKFRLTATDHVVVPFLVTQETLTAGRENNYKWIELPYKGGNYSMYLVRPTTSYKQDLQGMLEHMNGATLRTILKAKSEKNVALRMPKFKIKQKPAIRTALNNMGLKTIFTSQADLRQIADNLAVSDMAHEAYVDVNEEGTEAAAATVAAIHTLSANWNPNDMDFRLDEPFLAFVVDKVTSVPILAVKIVDPSA